MTNREIVEQAYQTELSNMVWKPIYPNNMKCNGIDGYYCLMLHKDKEGKVSGRKYSIVFQNEEVEKGTGLVNPNKINGYILFEKVYREIVGPLDYPEATDREPLDLWHYNENENTLHSSDMNDKGSFVYAYDNIEDAKKRALCQYKAIYGYVLSHMVED